MTNFPGEIPLKDDLADQARTPSILVSVLWVVIIMGLYVALGFPYPELN